MKHYIPLFATVLLSGVVACQSTHDPEGDGPTATAALALTSTCGAERWIGLAASCTAIPNWNAAPLFSGAAAPLDQYCVYDWASSSPPTPTDIAALPLATGAQELEEDCPVVMPQQSYHALLTSSLRASLGARVGTAETLGLVAKAKEPVRVVVVDTAPDSQEGVVPVGNDRHGDTVASIIRDIGCGSGGCAVEVASSLGLPWLDATSRSSAGGHVGRLSDVAVAVYNAIQSARADGRGHVIINLSIGWENVPLLAECDDTGSLAAPTKAVYDVLQYASCAGALVIAAAGNDAGGPQQPTGLICPGRWEAQPLTACPERAGEPMLHAVGGVDYADRPIAVTRPQGRPRLAAPAIGGVAWADGDAAPPPLSGTSVATAAASGVAAVVWSQRPNLSGAAVMDLLHASGVPLGAADTCAWGASASSGACTMRRISLCAALRAAGVPGLTCPAASPLATSTPPLSVQVVAAASQELSGILGTTLAEPADLTTLPRALAPSPALSGGVFPQPVVPVCPSCLLALSPSDAVLYASLATPLTAPSLVIEAPGATMSAPLATTTSLAAGTYAITVAATPVGVTRAWLTGFGDAGGTVSVTQELLLAH